MSLSAQAPSKKCPVCGLSIPKCQYKGKHPETTKSMINGHELVDLGLSVKWATKNVGANSPSDYGGYYAWGETSIKDSYDWSNCFDCLDNTGDSWGTYKDDCKTVIAPTSGRDTARENWGGTWRMPTEAEVRELCKKCKWKLTNMDGHNGCIVTGPNGNSIFLPAAGSREGTTIADHVGSLGRYWSNRLTWQTSRYAECIHFDSSNMHNIVGTYRKDGLSVRPVTE